MPTVASMASLRQIQLGLDFEGDRSSLRRNGFSRSKILLNVERAEDIAELVGVTVGSFEMSITAPCRFDRGH